MQTIKTTLDFPGDSIPVEVPGTRYIVTLTWTEAGQTFTVTVDRGSYRLYELGSVHDLVNDPNAETKARQRVNALIGGLADGMSVEALAQCVAMATVGQQVLDAPADEINDRFDAITALHTACADPRTITAEPAIAALQAQLPDDGDDVAARLNADLERRDREAAAHTQAFRQDIADIIGRPVAGVTPRQPEMQVGTATLAPYRPVVGQREILARRVNSRAHLQPLTGPQLRTIRNHRDGIVYCGKGTGVSPATLRSIASKGYGQVIKNGTRQFEVTGLRLNAAAIEAVTQ